MLPLHGERDRNDWNTQTGTGVPLNEGIPKKIPSSGHYRSMVAKLPQSRARI